MSTEVADQRESPTPAPPPPRSPHRGRIERWGLLGIFLLLIVVFSIAAPATFPTYGNLRVILNSQAITAIAALGLLIPLVGGRFDVSVGSILGFSSIVTAGAMSTFGLPLPIAILLGIVTGAVIGFVNGVIVAYLGVNSLIATLGMATIITGVVQWLTNGTPISSGIDRWFTSISVQQFLGVPMLAVVMIVVAILVWYLLTQTVYGRQLTAIGANLDAARLVGLRLRRNIMLSFVLSGLLGGLGGVLQLARQGSGDPSVGGVEFILPALAAVFLGATAFHPGRYNVPGTILGLFFVGVTVSGLALLGARTFVQPIFNGAIVIVAVAASQFATRRRTGEAPIGS